MNRNPDIETPRAYNLRTIAPELRPRDDKRTVETAGHSQDLPRQTTVWQARDDQGRPVFWCWCCDRRVADQNTPFCKNLHRAPRRNFVRRRAVAWKKPLPVTWALVDELNIRADDVHQAAATLQFATEPEERLAAAEHLRRASNRLTNYVRVQLPRRPARPEGMPPQVVDALNPD